MKRKILMSLFALALLITAGYVVNHAIQSDAGLSLLALNNIEALANGEDFVITCGQFEGPCWYGLSTPSGLYFDCFFTGFQAHYCVWNPFGI